jgi:hypothetical protein
MKTNLILFAQVVIFLLAEVIAQAVPPTVAVYDFKGDGDAASYGNNVTILVTADLTTETNLVMLERAELNKALNEEALGLSGMVSSDAAAKIGQITGAKVLVAGQVIKTGDNHLVVVADIIGTETGRLFADQVEGAGDNLTALASDLSHKIARTITDQATNLVTPAAESHEDYLNRIVKNIQGTNRPSISVSIQRYNYPYEPTIDGELGTILLKAGFKVVDGKSDYKPDIEIIGSGDMLALNSRGELFSCTYGLDIKIQERRTGRIIGFDHQESTATSNGQVAAFTAAQIKTIDALAERILPLLAK